MNFKVKVILQHIFSNIPYGERFNCFFQKNIKGLRNLFWEKVQKAQAHYEKYLQHTKLGNPLGGEFYEFGVGRDLIIPLTFFGFGINKQIITDLKKLITCELLNDTLDKFRENYTELNRQIKITRNPHQHFESFLNGDEVLRQLKTHFGISYIAPLDARDTSIDSDSIDFISTTDTFEHIPSKDIIPILKECWRILRPEGTMSNIIDLQDHYAYFDKHISKYNFLKYSESSWRFLNPSLHYQNRLRHKDYIEICSNAGFSILEDIVQLPSIEDLLSLKDIETHSKFSYYTPEELAIRRIHLVLRKEA